MKSSATCPKPRRRFRCAHRLDSSRPFASDGRVVDGTVVIAYTAAAYVARTESAVIEVFEPSSARPEIERAMDVRGRGGVSDDFGLANACTYWRTLHFADGPDDLHRNAVAKQEIVEQSMIGEALTTKKN